MRTTYLSYPISIALLASMGSVSAGEAPKLCPTLHSGLDAEFHVGYSSDYIFRGADAGGDLFEFGLDFAGAGTAPILGDVNWSAGMWYASFDHNSASYGNSSRNELDVYAEVSKQLTDMFSVAAGIINYSYFGNGHLGGTNDDIEPYIALSADIGCITLAAAAHLDGADNYNHDVYYEFTATHERALCENLTASLELILGVFDDSNVSATDDSDVYFGGTASVSYAVSDNITITPYVSATFSDDLGDFFFGGVSAGFGF